MLALKVEDLASIYHCAKSGAAAAGTACAGGGG